MREGKSRYPNRLARVGPLRPNDRNGEDALDLADLDPDRYKNLVPDAMR